MGDLNEALTLQRAGHESSKAFADPASELVNGMYGGWTAAIILRAVLDSSGRATPPSAITINFIDRIVAGTELRIHTRHLGGTRAVNHWQAEVRADQADTPLAYALVVLTERRDTDGFTEPKMPEASDPEALEIAHPPGPEGERVLVRPIIGIPPFGSNDTQSIIWLRETTGRTIDHLQLAFLSDQFAPRPFHWSNGIRPSATLTLSVYFHATDEEMALLGDDYILGEAIGTRGALSTSGQQVRLWSKRGDLLATSEQLAWYR